jgi:hypothetical protein
MVKVFRRGYRKVERMLGGPEALECYWVCITVSLLSKCFLFSKLSRNEQIWSLFGTLRLSSSVVALFR